MKKCLNAFGLIVVLLWVSSGCKKDVFIPTGNGPLSFSQDTVLFDTVFSTIGSITKVLKVYNNTTEDLTIESIFIAGLQNSSYRINIDGTPGPKADEIFLRERDSILLFIEVTVNPQNSNSPMIVSDSIEFITNNIKQNVQLVAWGQDAYYHTPNAFVAFLDANNDTVKFNYYSIPCNATWDNQKPHVIYGYAIVEPGCALNIDAGTKIHSYANSGIIVGSPFAFSTPSTLKINGTADNRVVFTHTRLDEFYKEDPGLWDRIWFTANSQNNEVHYATIKNGRIGIQADSNLNSMPTVKIENSWIHNHAGLGILGQGAFIEASNTIISNCGQYLAALTAGGKYDFKHCTFVNDWSFSSRNTPSVLISNFYVAADESVIGRPLDQASFVNCILYGNLTEEIKLDKVSTHPFVSVFEHCIVKTTELTASEYFINCIFNPANISVGGATQNPFFVDLPNQDYHLVANSPAVNYGISTTISTDYDNKTRDAMPDVGALEYVP